MYKIRQGLNSVCLCVSLSLFQVTHSFAHLLISLIPTGILISEMTMMKMVVVVVVVLVMMMMMMMMIVMVMLS